MAKQVSESGNGPVGSVMVVGGGIAGMQAALDLAESGYFVYLAEQKSAIGGVMAQLDKTFPTNDCSMCIISPKLVEAGRHLNIEILPLTEIDEVQGEPGHFRVRVRQEPRYIDPEKCTACGECLKVCPIDTPNRFDQGLRERKAIYKLYPQAMPSAFAIEKLGTSPCKANCPAHISIQGYVALIAQGKYKEALKLIKQEHPFPAVCGRVCHHPCEAECTRNKLDAPVAVEYLKRFVADLDLKDETRYLPERREQREERIAIVGGGPAGLTAAFYLAIDGFPVTVYEKLSVPGGMMAVGIPKYRMPQDVLSAEIQVIRDMGVEIRTGVEFGRDVTFEDLQREGYAATFLATGLHLSRGLRVEGEDLPGVLKGVEFLRGVALGDAPVVGKRVLVIGGGNVAVDVARTALRQGAEQVKMVCLERREEMPAWDYEIEEAEEEGVAIENSWGPRRFLEKDGRAAGVEFKRCTAVFDENGAFRPVYDESELMEQEADTVIVAIGQAADLRYAENTEVQLAPNGLVQADPVTLETSVPGVFAGGDCFYGPRSVVEAVAQGKEAALSIRRYVEGEDLREGRPHDWSYVKVEPDEDEPQIPRTAMRRSSVEERKRDYREIDLGFSEEEARAEAERCLKCGICSECYQCVEACLAQAVDHTMQPAERELEVGSIILAPGFEPFDPARNDGFYKPDSPNVLTSLAFERILSASGPFEGHLVRPSDHTEPKKMAWLQCVGSRSLREGDHSYCSSVCCMYAIKQAVIAKEHAGEELETAIFFMDMRTFGKDFEKYYDRAREEKGVRFVRSRVHSLVEDPETGGLLIRYVDEAGNVQEELFDMVVLSVGMETSQKAGALADKLGVDLNEHRFCATGRFTPVETSRPGVYVCGTFEAPRDIPETVMQASSAAAQAQQLLAESRNTLVRQKTYPEERDVTQEEPRIGVFVCDCGINIAGVVDVPAVREYAQSLPGVVVADENLFTCSQDTQFKMVDAIREHGLNRVIVASCSPRTHEPLFRETIRQAGLNPYLFEMANIRDQGSWVHQKEPQKATEKAKDLVRMAVAKVRNARALQQLTVPVEAAALVVGGGVAGMNAALNVADQGYIVHLVEKADRLGGIARRVHFTIEGDDVAGYLEDLQERVESHPKIQVHLNAEVLEHSGFVGNFVTQIADNGRPIELRHGVTVIATGGKVYEPKEYLYDTDPRVLTSLELEERIADGDPTLKDLDSVVMIQCVGSRNEEHPYCSRICCQGSVKNALKLKETNPDIQVFILYRDIRTYGLLEDFYRDARNKGVLFIRFDREHPPEVRPAGESLMVRVKDHVLGQEVDIPADVVSLAVGIQGDQEMPIATRFKLPLNADGFFMEAHMKLRPVDFSSDGNFLAGLAHGPKSIKETIAQAQAAAARAATILAKEQLLLSGEKARVDESRCVACLTCVRACPYHVPHIAAEKGVAEIEPAACQGCGICTSACPRKAIELGHYTDQEILAKVAALEE
jgi:heterodisulfide reductase subunit A-like polyferredoxin